jgi:hypothetical protein
MKATVKPIAKQIANDVRRDFQRIADISKKYFTQSRKDRKGARKPLETRQRFAPFA